MGAGMPLTRTLTPSSAVGARSPWKSRVSQERSVAARFVPKSWSHVPGGEARGVVERLQDRLGLADDWLRGEVQGAGEDEAGGTREVSHGHLR
jgi:hypothetical protein